MPGTTIQKLKIKEGNILLVINEPDGFRQGLGKLPPGVTLSTTAKEFNQVHWFVTTQREMKQDAGKVLPLVKGDVICWIYFPKGSSGIQTDLNRDKGWEELMKHDKQWINLISFDATWSAFAIREKTAADRRKEEKPRERPVFEFVDPKTKTVTLPPDFAEALKKAKKEEAFFNALSFTNKKEFIEWIVSAKRESTRSERVAASVERLGKEWKNPANRN